MDLYPANATDIQDPLTALLEDYNQGQSGETGSACAKWSAARKSRARSPGVIMLDHGHGGEDSGAVGKYRTREKMWCCRLPAV